MSMRRWHCCLRDHRGCRQHLAPDCIFDDCFGRRSHKMSDSRKPAVSNGGASADHQCRKCRHLTDVFPWPVCWGVHGSCGECSIVDARTPQSQSVVTADGIEEVAAAGAREGAGGRTSAASRTYSPSGSRLKVLTRRSRLSTSDRMLRATPGYWICRPRTAPDAAVRLLPGRRGSRSCKYAERWSSFVLSYTARFDGFPTTILEQICHLSMPERRSVKVCGNRLVRPNCCQL